MLLSSQTIKIVQATAPVIAPRSLELTQHFYKKMFASNPEVMNFFNQANHVKEGGQPQALANAVVAYATHIQDTSVLGSAVEIMAVKHCALQVLPEHYTIVHDNLMASIGDVFGDAITPDVATAWSEAVNHLAQILINRERELYTEAAERKGGWQGWKEFVVFERVQRTHDVVSWSFKRTDGYDDVFDFTPGQFLSIKLDDAKLQSATPIAPRHYTITSQPGDHHLQCSVKKIQGGYVSSWMHDNLKEGDTVMLSPPFGSYTLKTNPGKQSVFVSGGIGITPTIAFLKHLNPDTVAKIVHVDRSEDYPFKSFVETKYGDKLSLFNGGRSISTIDDIVAAAIENGTDNTFYICGPPAFMAKVVPALKAKGCSNVEYEIFGPQLAGLSCPMRKN